MGAIIMREKRWEVILHKSIAFNAGHWPPWIDKYKALIFYKWIRIGFIEIRRHLS